MSDHLATLKQKLSEIHDVHAAAALMQWDQEIFMPPKAAAGRGKQLSTLSTIAHRMFTDKEVGDTLKALQDQSGSLNADENKLVNETWYDYERATKLPDDYVQEFSLERSHAFNAWIEAKKDNNYKTFQPHLQKLTDLLHRRADYMGYEGSAYNALLEDYERGMRVETLKPVFDTIAKEQSKIVNQVTNAPQPDLSWLEQDWDEQTQWDFTMRVVKDLGFDFEAGRQDKSVHPFTTEFDLHDVRITTRIRKDDLFAGLMGSIHECGHGLYEQGFLESDERTTLGKAISLGIHESQSLMWENIVGGSLAFWKHYHADFQQLYGEQLQSISAEQLYQAANRVQPSFIRVEADECTYNLHIVLRFEIELALFEGEIKVDDIPAIWNEKMKSYLGLDVPHDGLGCLQDVHWSQGYIGYFPTYALGNLYAAQMFERIEKDIPNIWGEIEAGNFSVLLNWLREHVHHIGRRKTAPELIQDLTGSPLKPDAFLQYLRKKYGELYTQ